MIPIALFKKFLSLLRVLKSATWLEVIMKERDTTSNGSQFKFIKSS